MAVSYIGQATGTNTATPPTHAAGDLFILFAFRDGSNSTPSIPGGQNWSSAHETVTSNSAGALVVSKIAASSSEGIGTFTNATSVVLLVYRGVDQTTPIGDTNVATNASTTVSYPALSLQHTDGSSWVAGVAGHRSTNTTLENAPTGMTNRSTVADGTDEAAGHDTNGGVSSWSNQNVSVGGSSSGWAAFTLEIRIAGTPANDERDAKLTGEATANSSRGAKVVGAYTSPQYAQSTKINSGSLNIDQAVLYAKDVSTPDDSDLTYYMSADGGANWETVTPGTPHDFTNEGNDLRWRIRFDANTALTLSPEVSEISIVWTNSAGTQVSSERDATLHGTADISSERAGKTTGTTISASERAARLTGDALAISERAGRLTGTDTAESERDAHLVGDATANSSRAAKLTGVATANDERDATVTGIVGAASERDARLTGTADATSERSAKTTGGVDVTSERAAKLTGDATANAQRSAKTTGDITTSSTRAAKLTGEAQANSTRSAKLTGDATANAERSAKTTGGIDVNAERAAKLTGAGTLSTSERAGKIVGKLTAFATRLAKLTGDITVNSERAGKVTGRLTAFAIRAAKTVGKILTSSTRAGKTAGKIATNSTRAAKTRGVTRAESERDAHLTGGIDVFSTRSAKLTGRNSRRRENPPVIAVDNPSPFVGTSSSAPTGTVDARDTTGPFVGRG